MSVQPSAAAVCKRLFVFVRYRAFCVVKLLVKNLNYAVENLRTGRPQSTLDIITDLSELKRVFIRQASQTTHLGRAIFPFPRQLMTLRSCGRGKFEAQDGLTGEHYEQVLSTVSDLIDAIPDVVDDREGTVGRCLVYPLLRTIEILLSPSYYFCVWGPKDGAFRILHIAYSLELCVTIVLSLEHIAALAPPVTVVSIPHIVASAFAIFPKSSQDALISLLCDCVIPTCLGKTHRKKNFNYEMECVNQCGVWAHWRTKVTNSPVWMQSPLSSCPFWSTVHFRNTTFGSWKPY